MNETSRNLRVIQNVGIMTLGRISQSLLGIVALSVLARRLGPDRFGMLNFSAAILTYFSLLSSMGIPQMAMRQIARGQENIADMVNRTLSRLVALGAMAFFWLVVLSPILSLGPLQEIVLLVSGIELLVSAVKIPWAYAVMENMSIPAGAGLLGTVIRVGLVFALVHSPGDVVWAALATVGASAATAGLELWGFHRHYPIRLKFTGIAFISALRQSAPLAASALMTQIYGSMDSLFLGYFRGTATVGYYNAAYRLIWFLTSMIEFYVQTMFPIVSALYRDSPSSVTRFVARNFTSVLAVAVPITVGGWITAPNIIHMIYGPHYALSVTPFRLLLVGWLIMSVNVHYGNILVACDGESVFTQAVSVGAAVNVVGNLFMIPGWGMTGAAAMMILTESILGILFIRMATRRLGPYGPAASVVVRIFCNSLIMGGLTLIQLPYTVVGYWLPAAVFLYGILSVITQVVRWADLKRLFAQRLDLPFKRMS